MIKCIIGHTTDSSVKIWVKGEVTAMTATVTLRSDTPGVQQPISKTIGLIKADYNTATLEFTGLASSTKYDGSIIFSDGITTSVRFTTFPNRSASFNFLLVSCHFSQGKDHFSPEFTRIAAIAAQEKSLFMMNAGDQIYIDTAIRPFWVKSRDDYRDRYEETWYSTPVQYLFSNLPQYMILDDHEIYNNFANDNLTPRQQDLFNWATDAYRIFQHAHNPGNKQHFHYIFDCANASFFVMDARTHKTRNNIIDPEQLGILTAWINKEGPTDKIKFIVSSIPLFTQTDKSQQKDKWSGDKYKAQRDEVLALLMRPTNQKIVILSGDIHLASHAWISYQSNNNNKFIHELISSPIKQLQANVLSDEFTPTLSVGDNQVNYQLHKHMGYPLINGAERIHLTNNIMSITVNEDSLNYAVYAVNSEKVLFSDTIYF